VKTLSEIDGGRLLFFRKGNAKNGKVFGDVLRLVTKYLIQSRFIWFCKYHNVLFTVEEYESGNNC